MNWHKISAVALGIGSYAATLIPATVLIPGIGIPLSGVLATVCVVAAAAGISPEQVSPGVASFIKNLAVKKDKPNA